MFPDGVDLFVFWPTRILFWLRNENLNIFHVTLKVKSKITQPNKDQTMQRIYTCASTYKEMKDHTWDYKNNSLLTLDNPEFVTLQKFLTYWLHKMANDTISGYQITAFNNYCCGICSLILFSRILMWQKRLERLDQ